MGVSRQTVNAIERGDYKPSIRLCIAICRCLGKTPDALFWEGQRSVSAASPHTKGTKNRRKVHTKRTFPLFFAFPVPVEKVSRNMPEFLNFD